MLPKLPAMLPVLRRTTHRICTKCASCAESYNSSYKCWKCKNDTFTFDLPSVICKLDEHKKIKNSK